MFRPGLFQDLLSCATGTVALLASIALGACAPVVSHGPRVRDGTAVGVSGALLSTADGEAIQVVVPYLTVGNHRGAGNGGRQFTAQMVIPTAAFGQDSDNDPMILGMQGDYYRQAATGNDRFARGFGVHAGFVQVMPYGQWGVYENGVGVYTTQGIGSIGAYAGLVPSILFWSPGFGAEADLDGLTMRGSVSTMVGWNVERWDRMEGMPVSIGLSIEVGPAFARRTPGERE